MHPIFAELNNKLQLNYQHAEQLRKTTGKLSETTLQFNKDAINSAAAMTNVDWAYHEKTIKEYQKDFVKSFAALIAFANKNARELDRSRCAKALANDANFVANRCSRLHGANNNALDTIVTAAMLLQQVLNNALVYVDKKHEAYQNESGSNAVKSLQKTTQRTQALEVTAKFIQDQLVIAASKHNDNKLLIQTQWGNEPAKAEVPQDIAPVNLTAGFQTVAFQSTEDDVVVVNVIENRVEPVLERQPSGCCPGLFFRRKPIAKVDDEKTPLLSAQNQQ